MLVIERFCLCLGLAQSKEKEEEESKEIYWTALTEYELDIIGCRKMESSFAYCRQELILDEMPLLNGGRK